jgi:hypothetical protein
MNKRFHWGCCGNSLLLKLTRQECLKEIYKDTMEGKRDGGFSYQNS